ncbi:unnamed protein product, partial [Pylaiella littoralis]
QRAGFQSQRQTSANNGGVPSLIGGVCRHGAAALLHIKKKTVKHATKVRIAGEQTFDGVKMLAEKAKAAGLVTQPEFDDVMAVIVGADRNGVWPLYETERRHFAIYDNRKRTTEQDWGCVKNDEVSPGSAPRRLTPERHLMCRSAKGEGCSEFKEKKRSRCVHTLIVAIFTGVLGRGSTVARSGTTADADDASGSASSGGPVLPRTPQLLAK